MAHNLNFFAKNKFFVLIAICIAFAIDSKAQFTPGNIAVISAASASANNTTASILELNPAISNTLPVSTITIPGTGTDAIRISGSASSTCYLSNSNDGSLLSFSGHYSSNTTSNANALLTRAVVGIGYNGTTAIATTYTGASGNQTRCATSINNNTWYIGDQGGMYSNNTITASPTGNIRSVKSFGGVVYVEVQSSTVSAIQVNTLATPTGGTLTGLTGLTNNASIQDFYLVSSGSNGNTFDILYIISSTSATVGAINKYSLVGNTWVSNGSYPTIFGGFGLMAKYNSGGTATLYVTSGTGATAANTVIKLIDAAGFNTAINITTANNAVIYTAASGTTLKGIAWAPVYVAPPAVTLGVTPTTLNAFNTGINTTSSIDSITVNATNLTGNVTVTAPSSFEVSNSANGTYASTVSLTPASGTVNAKVYVRFHPINYGTVVGSLLVSTAGATAQNVAVSGTAPSPSITTSVAQIANSFSCYPGGNSGIDSFVVSGILLGGNVTVTAPNYFQVASTMNGVYSSSITLTPSAGTLANTTVYLMYSATTYNVTNDTVKISSSGVTTKNVKVSGFTINATNPVAFNLSTGVYNMNQWDSFSVAGTYPANMIFHTSNVTTPILAYNQLANNWNCVYDLISRSRINGLNADGISFINTSSPQYDNCSSGTVVNNMFAGAAVLAVNTTNNHNISMSFNMGMVKQGNGAIPRVCNLRLQYRFDTIQNYLDFNPITEYTSAGKIDGDVQAYSFTLPSNFENQSYVEFRWLYYIDTTAGGSGTRPQLRVDDIHVSACNSYATPLVSVSTLSNTVCSGNAVSFNANQTGGGQTPTYQWLLNGSPIAGANDSVYTTSTLNDGDMISLIMNTSEICYTVSSDTSTPITVSVNPVINPSLSIVSTQNTVCSGVNVNFYSNLNDGGYYASYQWMLNGSPIQGETNSNYVYQASGNGNTISLVVNTNYACATIPTLTSNDETIYLYSSNGYITPLGPTTICNTGGAVTIAADAGSNYLWNTGDTSQTITVNAAGNYTATYSDIHGCMVNSNPIAVSMKTMPAIIKIKTVGATTVCQPSVVSLLMDMTAGSTTGFGYQWKLNGSPIVGATDSVYNATASGTITLTVSGGGTCTKTSLGKIATVKPLPNASFSINGSTTFCAGGSVMMVAPTITGYTYSWYKDNLSAGAGNSKTFKLGGSYFVVAKLSGCTDTSSTVNVTVNPLPVAAINTTDPTTFCAGDSAILNATPSGQYYSYKWMNGSVSTTSQNPNYTAKVNGTFKVMVTDNNGCLSKTSTSSVKIKVNALPTATITASGSTTISATGSVKLNAMPTTGVTWQWYNNGSPIPNATTKQYTATAGGSYTVAITKLGCVGYSAPTVVIKTGPKENTGITSETENNSFEIIAYPNPVNDLLTIRINGLEKVNGSLEVMDMLGRNMSNGIEALIGNETTINMANYPSGNYLIHFKNEDGKTGSIKITKQ